MKPILPLLATASFAIGFFYPNSDIDQPADAQLSPPESITSSPSPNAFRRRLDVHAQCRTASPQELLAMLDRSLDDPVSRTAIAKRWAAVDPEGLLAYLQDMDPHQTRARAELEDRLLSRWTQADPEAAFQAALTFQMPSRRHRVSQVIDITQGLGHDLALGMIARCGDLRDDFSVHPWMTDDPLGALEKIAQLPESSWKQSALKAVSADLRKEDPAALVKISDKILKQVEGEARTQLLATWLEQDFESARSWVEIETTGKARADLRREVAEVWAETDPLAALAWAESHLQGQHRQETIGKLVNKLVADDPEEAVQFLHRLTGSTTKDKLIADMADTWAQNDPAATAAWLETVDNRTGRMDAYDPLVTQWGNQDMEALIAYATDAPMGPGVETLIHATADRLAAEHPIDAIAWAATLTEGKIGKAMEAGLRPWLSSRPSDATDHAATLRGHAREADMTALGKLYFTLDPDKSVAWAESLDNASDQAAVRDGLSRSRLKHPDRDAITSHLGW